MHKDWQTDWRIGLIALLLSALVVLVSKLGVM